MTRGRETKDCLQVKIFPSLLHESLSPWKRIVTLLIELAFITHHSYMELSKSIVTGENLSRSQTFSLKYMHNTVWLSQSKCQEDMQRYGLQSNRTDKKMGKISMRWWVLIDLNEMENKILRKCTVAEMILARTFRF